MYYCVITQRKEKLFRLRPATHTQLYLTVWPASEEIVSTVDNSIKQLPRIIK